MLLTRHHVGEITFLEPKMGSHSCSRRMGIGLIETMCAECSVQYLVMDISNIL